MSNPIPQRWIPRCAVHLMSKWDAPYNICRVLFKSIRQYVCYVLVSDMHQEETYPCSIKRH